MTSTEATSDRESIDALISTGASFRVSFLNGSRRADGGSGGSRVAVHSETDGDVGDCASEGSSEQLQRAQLQ